MLGLRLCLGHAGRMAGAGQWRKPAEQERHELSGCGLQRLFAKLHPQIPIPSPVLPCAILACHVLQLGRGCKGTSGTGDPAAGWRCLGTHGLAVPEEGREEEVGAAFGDQVTILCVPDPPAGASILSR